MMASMTDDSIAINPDFGEETAAPFFASAVATAIATAISPEQGYEALDLLGRETSETDTWALDELDRILDGLDQGEPMLPTGKRRKGTRRALLDGFVRAFMGLRFEIRRTTVEALRRNEIIERTLAAPPELAADSILSVGRAFDGACFRWLVEGVCEAQDAAAAIPPTRGSCGRDHEWALVVEAASSADAAGIALTSQRTSVPLQVSLIHGSIEVPAANANEAARGPYRFTTTRARRTVLEGDACSPKVEAVDDPTYDGHRRYRITCPPGSDLAGRGGVLEIPFDLGITNSALLTVVADRVDRMETFDARLPVPRREALHAISKAIDAVRVLEQLVSWRPTTPPDCTCSDSGRITCETHGEAAANETSAAIRQVLDEQRDAEGGGS